MMLNISYLHIAHRILLSMHNIQSRFLAWYEQNEQWGMDINLALLRCWHCSSLRIPFTKRKWNLNMKNLFAEWRLIELYNEFCILIILSPTKSHWSKQKTESIKWIQLDKKSLSILSKIIMNPHALTHNFSKITQIYEQINSYSIF
jgi:hypothetical protein